MKTAQHTPGPWQYGIGNDGASIVSGDVVIGHTFEPDDARLIAAAPDLLAALIEAVAEFDAANNELDNGYFHDTGAIVLARNAIAKATGGDHAR